MVSWVAFVAAVGFCLVHAFSYLGLCKRAMERKGRRTRLYASAIPFMLLVVILANEVIVASGRTGLPIWLWLVVGVGAGTVMGELSTRLSERLSKLI